MNALLCVAAVLANAHHQVFCRPVLWASVVLVITFTPVILLPILWNKELGRYRAIHFLLGIAACICVYCIVFLCEMNFWGLLSPLGGPLAGPLTFVPHFFLLQILLFIFRSPESRPFRKHIASGGGLCAVYAVIVALWFNLHYATIRSAYASGDTSAIPQNYMTERMLGMHFKYHLSFCMYDGWRPPLHDPSLVVAVWLTAPFRADLDYKGFAPRGYRQNSIVDRIAVYKAVFPDRPVRMDCSCAKGYSKFYFNDLRLR